MTDKLDRLQELEDGWDGRGSLAPTEKVIEYAREVNRFYKNAGIEWDIFPTDEGTITFTRDNPVDGEMYEHDIRITENKVICSGFSIEGNNEYEVNYDLNYFLTTLKDNLK